MPGMSGLDLIRLLTARGSKLPAIMVTGRLEPGLEAKAAAGGAVCLLMKPFEIDALMNCLERVLKI
jgi:FixJ family two-component response regulator